MREVFLCMKMNFQKWRIDPRIYVVAAGVFAFSYWTSGPLVQLAEQEGVGVSPWVLSFFFENPLMMTLYGCFVILLFANAPFMDRQGPFVMIRLGRTKWIAGQMLYLVVGSFMYVLFWFVTSVLVILPRVEWTADWGDLLIGMAAGGVSAEGIALGIFPNAYVMRLFYGWSGALLQFGLLWLVALFFGCLLFAGNLFTGKSGGIVITGGLTMLPIATSTPYFIGLFGEVGTWFSPLCWCSLSCLNLDGTKTSPSISYVAGVLAVGICVCMAMSAVMFCKRDVEMNLLE